jgi:hypothetical protein
MARHAQGFVDVLVAGQRALDVHAPVDRADGLLDIAFLDVCHQMISK